MAETADYLLFVQVSSSSLQSPNRLHLSVHSQRLVPRTACRLLRPGIQTVQLVRLPGAVVALSGDPMVHE